MYDKKFFKEEISDLEKRDSLVKIVSTEFDISYSEAIKLIELNMLTEVFTDYKHLYSDDIFTVLNQLARQYR